MSGSQLRLLVVIIMGFAICPAFADDPRPRPGHNVLGISHEQLEPGYWVSRLEQPDRVVFERAAIAAQNERLLQQDPSMHDLKALPATLARGDVAAMIEALASPPAAPLYDADGREIAAPTLDAIVANRHLSAIPVQQATRYGMVVQRASLRSFPTELRVFRSPGKSDIDRFQESALFPGTPVVIAHESRDRRWSFVVSRRYAAWIESQYVAEGSADQVLAYRDRTPYRIVTAAVARTVFSPEQPAFSRLELDMGVRLPVLAEWSADVPVNGQLPYSAHVIELPLRTENGRLAFAPGLLQINADSADDFLPLTRANIIRQGFKFLGERYGWGHSYESRDCSGFVSEVYRSMGVLLPRNTSAQSVSPALQKTTFGPADGEDVRMDALRRLSAGDLIFMPGHVMMAIGTIDGEPWVIHDTAGVGYRAADASSGDASGKAAIIRVPLNAVAVTPLVPLVFNETERYVDRITSIVRVVPDQARETPQPL